MTTIYLINKQQIEREAAYEAALKLVEWIDAKLTRGVVHYRNMDGQLLRTLDEVTRAIIADDLAMDEPERLAA